MGATSTETRLIVDGKSIESKELFEDYTYDPKEFEEKLYYHNWEVRDPEKKAYSII